MERTPIIVSHNPLWYMYYIQGRIAFESLLFVAEFEQNSMFVTGALFEGCIGRWSLQGFNVRKRRTRNRA